MHSIISYGTYITLWPVNPPFLLLISDQCLRTLSSKKLNLAGYFDVNFSYNSSTVNLPMLVVERKGKSLIGRRWFDALHLNLTFNVNKVYTISFDSILQEFRDVFNESLGKFKEPAVSIKIDENCSPKFLKVCVKGMYLFLYVIK